MRALCEHLARIELELDQVGTVRIEPRFSRANTRAAGERSRWIVTVDDHASGLAVSCEDGWRAMIVEGGSHIREIARGITTRREAGRIIAQASAR